MLRSNPSMSVSGRRSGLTIVIPRLGLMMIALTVLPGCPGMTMDDGIPFSLVELTAAAPVSFAAPIMTTLHDDASATATHLTPIQATDMDGDGRMDLFAALNESTRVGLAFGAGDGSFTQAAPTAGFAYGNAVFGDTDNDGLLDIFVKAFTGDESLQLLLAQMGRTFDAQSPDDGFEVGDRVYPARDFDGDGDLDVVFVRRLESFDGQDLIQFDILNGRGDGTLFPPVPFSSFSLTGASITGEIGPVAFGDFNGDGAGDFVVVFNSDNPSVVIGIANVGMTGIDTYQVTRLGFDNVVMAIAVDLNNDNLDDLILQEQRPAGASEGGEDVNIHFTQPDGSFDVGSIRPSGLPRSVSVGQLTDDDFPDIAIMTGLDPANPGPVAIYVNLGTDRFALEQTLDVSALASPFHTCITDVNGDGMGDLVVGDTSNQDVAIFVQE
ncbi:MAG TPA: VCBS repeat-containing protein [Phycisphaerae bacterium]|nr:VCBS repeat-containing protein [Phycisphaerae bacterium]HRW55941.1 VCBS repeat-containing protein [Phycisphaerae bacterium]